MTPEEFRECMTRYGKYFPDFRRWMNSLEMVETKITWAELFDAIERSDLMAAIDLVVNGNEKIPYRDHTAVELRRIAREIRDRRLDRIRRRTERAPRESTTHDASGFSIGRAWGNITKRVKNERQNQGVKQLTLEETKLIAAEEIAAEEERAFGSKTDGAKELIEEIKAENAAFAAARDDLEPVDSATIEDPAERARIEAAEQRAEELF